MQIRLLLLCEFIFADGMSQNDQKIKEAQEQIAQRFTETASKAERHSWDHFKARCFEKEADGGAKGQAHGIGKTGPKRPRKGH